METDGLLLFDVFGYAFGGHATLVALTATAMLALGVTVMGRERNTRVSVFFFILSLAVAIWLGCYALMYASPDAATAERWARAGYLGAPFVPAASYMFTTEILNVADKRGWVGAGLWAAGSIVAVGILAGGWVITDMYHYSWGYYPDYDLAGGITFITLICVGIGATVFEWLHAYRTAESDARRKQAWWFLLAFAIAPIVFFDFIPSFDIAFYPFGYLVVGVVDAIMALAILRYDLVELTPSFAAEKIIGTMADPMVVCDASGTIKVTNDAVEGVFGVPGDSLEGRRLDELLDDHDRAAETLLDDPVSPLRDEEMTFEPEEGRKIVCSISRNPITGPEGEPVGAVVITRDITKRKRAEAALKRSQRRYELAAEGAHDGLWDWDLEEERVFYSERWQQMLGLEETEVSDAPDEWLDRIHEEDRERFETVLEAQCENGADHFEVDYRIAHEDGDDRWMLCRGAIVRDEAGEAVRMAGSQTDITERKRAEAQLRHDAFHDALTEVPNRALFIDRVEQLLKTQGPEAERPFSVLFMDLDRFKAINDSLGHTTGDALLKRVTERTRECLRTSDTMARLGGDEFGILLVGTDTEQEARRMANRIRARLEEPFVVDDHRLYVSASIGVLVSKGQYESPKRLLRDADLAMYNAKRNKLKQIAVFEDGMETSVVDETHLESALREAIEAGELALNYHPIVELDGQTPVAFEALARWHSEEFGTIPPNEFIPLAEETGLIVPLGRWVLREACAQTKAWLDAGLIEGDFAINVNLSAPEISSPNLVDTIADILEETGLDGRYLQVEITERILITNPDDLEEIFDELQAMDVRICIDDFGTGYSSLSYLRRFRADSLKIDREFVQGVHRSEEDQEIVRAVLRLAGKFGLEVVAEGIESQRQLERLQDLGIDLGQGFLWAKPRSTGEIEKMLQDDDETPAAAAQSVS